MCPSPRRLLVVERDEDIRIVIEELVTDHAYVVRHAATVDEAIRELSLRGFDVVLFHLRVLRMATARPGSFLRSGRNMRIVSMSASEVPDRSDEVDAHLSKPFSRAQLLTALSS